MEIGPLVIDKSKLPEKSTSFWCWGPQFDEFGAASGELLWYNIYKVS